MNFLFASSSPSIENLEIHFNSDSWGPSSGEKINLLDTTIDIPYTHFDKKEKCGRHADFVQAAYTSSSTHQKYQRRREENDFSFKHDAVEDSTFQLVDTSRTQSKTKYTSAAAIRGKTQTKQVNNRNALGRTNVSMSNAQQSNNLRMKTTVNKTMNRRIGKQERISSLAVGAEWMMIEEFDLQQLLKLAANLPKVEDLLTCGHVDQYDESFDKITSRTAKPLRRVENKFFTDVTTMDDPIIGRLAAEQAGEVYATDAILALLMTSPRSVYSWDIIIEKANGVIFLDKRDDSTFDLLTVSETAQEPPIISDEREEINHPDKLSLEATMINQNFSQQILLDSSIDGTRKSFEVNPFGDDLEPGMEMASVVYRYRRFTLGNIRLVARCEVHCWTNKRNEEQMISSHALHEWDSRYSGGINWRNKIDSQRVAVLATELKNNSCRLARWTAQSLLAGADQMKLGYVSRVTSTNAYEHVILATQFFKPKDFALQINLSLTNIWGIIKMICELLINKEDGKYVLMKDPNKQIVRLYSIPIETFEDDEENVGDDDDLEERANEDENME